MVRLIGLAMIVFASHAVASNPTAPSAWSGTDCVRSASHFIVAYGQPSRHQVEKYGWEKFEPKSTDGIYCRLPSRFQDAGIVDEDQFFLVIYQNSEYFYIQDGFGGSGAYYGPLY